MVASILWKPGRPPNEHRAPAKRLWQQPDKVNKFSIQKISGAPLIFKTMVDENLSGAPVGTKTVTPAASLTVFSFLRAPKKFVFKILADEISFFNPGTTSLPSSGHPAV